MPKTKINQQKSKLIKRATSLLIKYWPILIVFGLVVVFAFPYWAKGLIPFPADHLVNSFPPWQYYFGLPVKNAAMPDVITQMYPWKHLVINLWKSGQWPLWNPYNFSGSPLLANYQSAVFHPFNFLFFLLPEVDAWSFLILLQPLLAGLFTYLFCRELKLSQEASLLSSIAFMFCGFITTWMAYGTMAYALLWLPLILYGIQKSFYKISAFSLILISFSLAASLFSGHFQISLYVLLASLGFLLFKLIVTRQIKVFFLGLLFIVLGVLLASVQILPSFELYQLSSRSQFVGLSEIVPWNYLITLLSPDFFGNDVTRNNWFGHYAEWSGFTGVIPLILAAYVFFKKKRKPVLFFSSLIIVSLLLSRPTSVLDLIIKLKIPIFSSSAAARVNGLFSFSIAILAGFGLDELKNNLKNKNFKKLFLVSILFLGVALTTWGVLILVRPFSFSELSIARRNFILPSGMISAFGILVFGFWLLNRFFKKKKDLIRYVRLIIPFLLLLLIAFDLFRFAKKWVPFDSKEHVYPQVPILSFLTKTAGPNRVFGFFGMEMMNYYQIQGFNGYDPLFIQRYGELLTTAGDGKIKMPSTRGTGLGIRAKYTMELLNLMGGKYVLHALSDGRHPWAFPFWEYPEQLKLIYGEDKYEVYENKKALPRAFLFYNYQIIEESQEIINQMLARGLDLKETLILEEEPEIPAKDIKEKGQRKAEIIEYFPNQVKLRVETENPGLLFLSDNYYPGWKAFVNGQEKKIYRANYSFRAVVVPQGIHEVEFVYSPSFFKLGLRLSFLSLLALLLFGFLIPRWKK